MVVFVQSYPNLINTLYLLYNSFIYEKITVYVVGNLNLYKFLNKTKKKFKKNIDVIFIKQQEVLFNSVHDFIKSFIKIKLSIYRTSLSIKLKNCDIYFFSRAFTTLGFYLINNVKKNNQLIHFPDPGCDIYQLSDLRPSGLKQTIILIVYKLLYGKDLVFGNAGRKLNANYFFKISENYFYKNVDLSVTVENRIKLQQYFTLNSFIDDNLNNFLLFILIKI